MPHEAEDHQTCPVLAYSELLLITQAISDLNLAAFRRSLHELGL